jgi:uncharacterized membrane protein YczE
VYRAVQLLAGLVLYGVSLALLVRAHLGLDPWDVFHQGVSRHTGLSLGQVTVISSVLLLAAFFPLHQRAGIGTVANALIVGVVLDAALSVIPAPDALAWRAVFLIVSILGTAVATGLYIGVGWGPGPRDGLMTGLSARGIPLLVARTAIELTVLAIGFALGGSVGIGTVLFAVSIGPLVSRTLPRLALRPHPKPESA